MEAQEFALFWMGFCYFETRYYSVTRTVLKLEPLLSQPLQCRRVPLFQILRLFILMRLSFLSPLFFMISVLWVLLEQFWAYNMIMNICPYFFSKRRIGLFVCFFSLRCQPQGCSLLCLPGHSVTQQLMNSVYAGLFFQTFHSDVFIQQSKQALSCRGSQKTISNFFLDVIHRNQSSLRQVDLGRHRSFPLETGNNTKTMPLSFLVFLCNSCKEIMTSPI